MADVQSGEEFDHYHRDCLKDLEIEQHRLDKASSSINLGGIDDELRSTLKNKIREKLSDTSRGPEHIFKQAIKSLKEADLTRFIIENALEAMKNGKSIQDIVSNYIKLGLIQPTDNASANLADQTPLESTTALVERKGIWERVMGTLGHTTVNAIKSVPKWIEIEPHIMPAPPFISFAIKA